MTNELSKIDPKEYGLEQKQVATIEQAFAPKIAERDALIGMYEMMLTAEITPAVCKQAKELRNKFVKVRTGIAEIHKTQKMFFLRAGQFVDAWKNKETVPIEQMEENLTDIEKYYEKLEAEKVAKLAAEREAEIRKYSPVIPYDLGNMDQTVYDNYLVGVRVAMEARLAAEKAAEDERIKQEKAQKEKELKIRQENARLKKEAEEKEAAMAAERAEALKHAMKLAAEIEAAEAKAATERAETDRKLKEQQEQYRKDAEKAVAGLVKLQAELEAKKAAELKAKMDAELKLVAEAKAREDAAKAPRKEKLTKWVDGFAIPAFENDLVATEISMKFAAFKGWAKGQVEKL